MDRLLRSEAGARQDHVLPQNDHEGSSENQGHPEEQVERQKSVKTIIFY